MSRQVRIEFQNAFYHVICRGYLQMFIFHDAEDFEHFLSDLKIVFDSHGLVIHSFCIMNNHIHLFVETPLGNLQKAMHRLLSRYSAYYKKKYGHKGKVFEKRYTAFLVDTDVYALDLSRYIHLNPVEVIVQDPASWQYSSYRSFLDYDLSPCFLDKNLVLNKLDSDYSKAQKKFIEFHKEEGSCLWYPEKYLLGNTILGSKSFLERIRHHLPKEIDSELTGLLSLKTEERVPLIFEYVLKTNLDAKTKSRLLIFCLRKKTSLNSKEIGELLGENDLRAQTISYRINALLKQSKKEKGLEVIIRQILNSSEVLS